MCSGPEQLNPETPSPSSSPKSATLIREMNNQTGTVKTQVSFSGLLELAADNDVEGFKQSILRITSAINEMGLWYGRQRVSKQMVLEYRTPLMVAATYGSIDVVKLVLSLSKADVNRSCGPDKSTALHCAASSGSVNAVDVVKLLLLAGADPNCSDANGHRPFDVIVTPPEFACLRNALEELLRNNVSDKQREMQVSSVSVKSDSLSLSSSPGNASLSSASSSSVLDFTYSPNHSKLNDISVSSSSEKKEYPIDPSLPDIKNSVYSTDEFRMFSFKIRHCSRAYSHDWTECPFVHPGENARRRDPRKFHYSCVPCPDFRKGQCRRGDLCEYAHGVFECWLHPAQYRTRLCKDGTTCSRRVCFFAHTTEELRPLYVSGSAVPSPRCISSAAATMDFAAALSLLPGSPSAFSAVPPFSPPVSPSGSGITHTSMAWPQPNVPTLHLSGSNLQTSRLRSSFNARDIPPDDLNMLLDFEVQQQRLLNDMSCFSQTHLNSSSTNLPVPSKSLSPSNLDELFSAEVSSPQFSDQVADSTNFSPLHKSMVLNQFQQQQNMTSPIDTNVYSPKNVDNPCLQVALGFSSPGRISPRGIEPQSQFSSRLSSLAHREWEQQQQLRSLSSRDLGANLPHDTGSNGVGIVGSPVNSLSNWESPNSKVDWSVTGDELSRVSRSLSVEHNGDEPDFSWVQSLVKESPPEIKEMPTVSVSDSATFSGEGSNLNSRTEKSDHAVLGAWLEQMQLDQIVA